MWMPPAVVRKVIPRSVDSTPVMTAAVPAVPGAVVVVAGEVERELVALGRLPSFVAVQVEVLEDSLLTQHIFLSIGAAEEFVKLSEVVRQRGKVAKAGEHLHGAELGPRRLVLRRCWEARGRGWSAWRRGPAGRSSGSRGGSSRGCRRSTF